MANNRIITKVKAAMQDLLLGPGTTIQARQGNNYTVNNIAAVWLVSSLAELKDFPTETGYAGIANGAIITEYWYDSSSTATPDDDTVVLPNSNTGRWLKRITTGA